MYFANHQRLLLHNTWVRGSSRGQLWFDAYCSGRGTSGTAARGPACWTAPDWMVHHVLALCHLTQTYCFQLHPYPVDGAEEWAGPRETPNCHILIPTYRVLLFSVFKENNSFLFLFFLPESPFSPVAFLHSPPWYQPTPALLRARPCLLPQCVLAAQLRQRRVLWSRLCSWSIVFA